MRNNLRISLVTLTIMGGALLQSCQKDDHFDPKPDFPSLGNHGFKSEKPVTFYGPTVPIGSGVARAWVKENEDGEPLAVGINLSEKALENLPDQATQFVLFFPKTKGMNFYKHMLVDWNPQGHEPEHVYDIPHFDFHFYIVPNEERLVIPPAAPPYFDPAPDAKYVPDNYLETPGIVPQMGAHWVDLEAPEFTGGTFSRTYIWGSYQGNFIFFEPMITRGFLLSHTDEKIELRQPDAFQRDGWYPTYYEIDYRSKPGQYTIALTGLKYSEGE